MFDDVLNPKFVHFSALSESELDPFRRLPKQALVAHIDDAIRAWGCPCGFGGSNPTIEYMEPVIGAQTIRIDIWVERLDRATCTYGFLCSSRNGNVAYARGERTVATSAADLSHNAALLKDLPAYA
jgi:hypothetical protein